MSFSLLPNALVLIAILGIAIIVLRHLPDALKQEQTEDKEQIIQKLSQKGLPAKAITRISYYAKLWKKRLWNFLLETKDLKPTAKAGYQIKKIFGRHSSSDQKEQRLQPYSLDIKTEQSLLEAIKKNPKNLSLYNDLGKFYLEHGNLNDAKDIYQYLVSHDPTSSEFFARLAQCSFKLKDFQAAVENYDRSLAIDSTHPNRYYNKSLALENLGRYKEAIENLHKAIGLEAKNVKFHLNLAAILIKIGKNDEAKTSLLKAKEIEPWNADIVEKLKNL